MVIKFCGRCVYIRTNKKNYYCMVYLSEKETILESTSRPQKFEIFISKYVINLDLTVMGVQGVKHWVFLYGKCKTHVFSPTKTH
jgi:hypothetical protein